MPAIIPAINEIQVTINNLKQVYNKPAVNLKNRLKSSYANKVIETVDSILSKHGHVEPDEVINQLEQFLVENWNQIKGTALSYTALPDNNITHLLCDIAALVSSQKNNDEINSLTALMPTLNINSVLESYPDLNVLQQSSELKRLLKTHILGNNCLYLIPVDLLGTLDLSSPLLQRNNNELTQLRNPYWDYENAAHEGQHHLSGREFERLCHHSPMTVAILDAFHHYNSHVSDTNNLLGQLNQLTARLYFNSVNGIGNEENAGSGVYNAILNFMKYYQSLVDDDIAKIPEDVQEEIKKILSFSSDPEANRNAAAVIGTCVATRREKLEKAIQGNEQILSEITLAGRVKDSLIADAKKQFVESIKSLHDAVQEGSYSKGYDKLSINGPLLAAFGIQLNISSLDDLRDFLGLNPNEIAKFCAEEEIQKQIIDIIPQIEELVLLSLDTSPEKLKVLFNRLGPKLQEKFIKKPNDLSAMLVTLDDERLFIFCASIKEGLTNIIKSGYELRQVFRYLTNSQRDAACLALKDCLPDILTCGDQLEWVLQFLSSAQQTVILDAIKINFPQIITSGYILSQIFHYLSNAKRSDVLEALNDRLADIIRTSNDFNWSLKYLSPSQRTVVFCELQDNLAGFIHSCKSLEKTFQFLNRRQRALIFNEIKDRLAEIIGSDAKFGSALRYLSISQREEAFKAVEHQLPKMISSGFDLGSTLQYLSPPQRNILFKKIINKLPEIIKSGYGLAQAIRFLTKAQRRSCLKNIQHQLPGIIKSGTGLGKALQYFSKEQRTSVLESILDQLPGIIKSVFDLREVLKHLSEDQCKLVCHTLREQLPKLVKSDDDLRQIIEYIPEERREVVLHFLKSEMSQSEFCLNHENENLSEEPRAKFYDGCVEEKLEPDNSPVKLFGLFHNHQTRDISIELQEDEEKRQSSIANF